MLLKNVELMNGQANNKGYTSCHRDSSVRDPFKIQFTSIADGKGCSAEFTKIIIVIQLKT